MTPAFIVSATHLLSFPFDEHKMGKKGGIFLSRDGKKRVEHLLSHVFELPKDLVMDLPRITMLGDMQVHVENHRGIIEYTKEKIRISTGCGELLINGSGLVLRNILPDEIVVDGRIRSIAILE